jgi:hypothetical protein
MNPKKYRSILTLHWNDKVGTKKYIQKVDEIVLPESVDLKEIERKYGIKSNNTPSRHVKLYKKDVEFFKEHVSIDWDFKKYDYFINYCLIDTSPPPILKESYFVLEWFYRKGDNEFLVGELKITNLSDDIVAEMFQLKDNEGIIGDFILESKHSLMLKKYIDFDFNFDKYEYFLSPRGVYE